MTRYLKLIGLWIGVYVSLVLIAAGFAFWQVDTVAKLIFSSFLGGGALLAMCLLFLCGYSPKEPVKTPALIVIGVTVVMSGPLKEVPLVFGMILGTLLCWWMLERSRMIFRAPSVA